MLVGAYVAQVAFHITAPLVSLPGRFLYRPFSSPTGWIRNRSKASTRSFFLKRQTLWLTLTKGTIRRRCQSPKVRVLIPKNWAASVRRTKPSVLDSTCCFFIILPSRLEPFGQLFHLYTTTLHTTHPSHPAALEALMYAIKPKLNTRLMVHMKKRGGRLASEGGG